MKTANLLILEDDIETLSVLLDHIARLEEEFDPVMDIDITVFSNYKQVENLVNTQPRDAYDIILLDRDCKMAGSFHVLDIEGFGPERIISISSTPKWNEDAHERGIRRIVLKEYDALDKFGTGVVSEIKSMLG